MMNLDYRDHNKKMLQTYTRDNGSKQLRIAQLNDSGNMLRVFKNRYQAAKFLYENNLSNYNHPKGDGYSIACIAGSLTTLIQRNIRTYGFIWKILSPYDTKKYQLELFKHGRLKTPIIRKIPRWIVFFGNKKKKFFMTLDDIAKETNIKLKELSTIADKGIVVNGLSIIKYTDRPVEKTFDSITKAAAYLRVSKNTVHKMMKNSSLVHNYLINIPDDKMKINYSKIDRMLP